MGNLKTNRNMENTEEKKEGKYIYGIIRNQGKIDLGPIGIGKRGNSVYGISYNDICAIVSNSPVIQYEAKRVNLTAHEIVLEEIMKRYPVLPVRFSTIADTNDDSGIQKILERDYDRLSAMLDQIEGKKELGLKVIATEETIYPYILEKYDDIKTLKEKLVHLPADKTYYQRMKIGEMVEAALQKEKEHFKKRILDHLSPLATDIKINGNYGERMLLNAAFLIRNEIEASFDEAVNELDEQLGNLLTFKYVGTLPPYNFVNLIINI
ncbi:MAG: GvpL/GvpF family gas vesicle protein [Mangrovibacterium sp.]